MNGVFQGSILSNVGKKTKRMKWKVTLKQVSKTDASLKINAETDGKKQTADLLIHNNPNYTINIDGYFLNGKMRKPITIKNMKLTENAMKEKFAQLQ